jgi:hypothetical protein
MKTTDLIKYTLRDSVLTLRDSVQFFFAKEMLRNLKAITRSDTKNRRVTQRTEALAKADCQLETANWILWADTLLLL